MSGFANFTPDEQSELDLLRSLPAGDITDAQIDRFDALIAKAERSAQVEAIRNAEPPAPVPGFNFNRPAGEIDRSNATAGELRDASLRVLESEGRSLAAHQLDHVDHLLRGREAGCDAKAIAKSLLTTETDAYRSGFAKALTGNEVSMSADERAAMAEYRAANEGTGSQGGFGIPVLIDPTIILTSGAVDAPVVDLSRVVTITTDAWKGVSSQGTTWAYQGEASVVADDSSTLAQPTITVYAARGFIPYSIEVGQDYPGFAEELSMLLGQGYIDMLASQTVVGAGSSNPRGVFTAVSTNTTNPTHVTVTTAGVIDGVSLRKTWAALPQRFRSRATWLYSPGVDAQVRGLGNNLALSDYTVNILAGNTPVLFGRPAVTSDYAPGFTGTTGQANYVVVGDFSTGYVIAQRAGMTVEPIQTLFDPTSGRPTGQRGIFAWARHGADVVNQNAFRILANS